MNRKKLKMTVEKIEKARTVWMNCIEKRRLEMGPRIMETRKRDPGCKRDQEFWCRVGEGNHCGIVRQGRAEVAIEKAFLDARMVL